MEQQALMKRKWDELFAMYPDFANATKQLHEQLYTRPRLSEKERTLVTLASLIATRQLGSAFEFHVNSALTLGITFEQIQELVFHSAYYTGFPNAIEVLYVLEKIRQHEEEI